MKKLLTLLFLFSFFLSHAQEDTTKYQKYPNSYGPQYKDLWATRVLRLPDTTGHRPQLGVPGALGRNPAGTQLFVWDGSAWQTISGGSSTRDTAGLTFGWGFIPSQNPYKPNGLSMSVTLDSAALQNFIDTINASDTTIGQVVNNASFIVKFHANAPAADAEGDQTLVGTTPTGLFIGHANEIATKVGAAYTFETATSGDNLIVNNSTTHVFLSYRFDGSTWHLVNVVVIAGGNSGVGDLPIGTYDSHDVYLITKNLPALSIDTNQNVSLPKFINTPSNNYAKFDSATGNFDTGFFRQLIAGSGVTISSGPDADTISSTSTSDTSYPIEIVPIYTNGSAYPITLTTAGLIVPYARTIILDSLWTTYDGTPYYSGLASIVNAPDGDTVELQLLDAYDSSYITGGSSVVSNSYAYTVSGSTEYDFTTNQYNLTKDGSLAYASTSIAGSAFGKSATFDGTQPSYVGTTGLTGSRSVNFPANTGTIECFFKLTSLGKNQALICKWGDGNSTAVDSYILYVNSSNQLVATFKKTTNANIAVTGSTTLTTGVLYHAAWVLTGTTSTLFLNGVSDGTTTWSGGINAAATTSFTIGKDSVTDANPYLALFGSIDEVRVSSINRYGGTFTVPTAPFVADANTISLIHFDNTQPSLYSGTAIIKTPFVNMSTTYKSILYKVINHQANRANLINLTFENKYVP
jgi:hypothetical protein